MLRKRIIRVNGRRNVPNSLPRKRGIKEARFTLQTPIKGESKSKNGGGHPSNGGLQPPQPVAPLSPSHPRPLPAIPPLSLKRSRSCSASRRTKGISPTTTSTTRCRMKCFAGASGHHLFQAARLRGRDRGSARPGAHQAPEPEEEEERAAWIFWTIPFACTSARWARSLCSPASRKWRSPNASRPPKLSPGAFSLASASPARSTLPWPRNSSPIRPTNALTASLSKESGKPRHHLTNLRRLVRRARDLDRKLEKAYEAMPPVRRQARRPARFLK